MAAGVVDADLMARTVDILSEVRAGEEAREGISAFFEKRRPSWDSE
jgi:methylglutaconyl-CoA hydratase